MVGVLRGPWACSRQVRALMERAEKSGYKNSEMLMTRPMPQE
jgi:hypothetical protein